MMLLIIFIFWFVSIFFKNVSNLFIFSEISLELPRQDTTSSLVEFDDEDSIYGHQSEFFPNENVVFDDFQEMERYQDSFARFDYEQINGFNAFIHYIEPEPKTTPNFFVLVKAYINTYIKQKDLWDRNMEWSEFYEYQDSLIIVADFTNYIKILSKKKSKKKIKKEKNLKKNKNLKILKKRRYKNKILKKFRRKILTEHGEIGIGSNIFELCDAYNYLYTIDLHHNLYTDAEFTEEIQEAFIDGDDFEFGPEEYEDDEISDEDFDFPIDISENTFISKYFYSSESVSFNGLIFNNQINPFEFLNMFEQELADDIYIINNLGWASEVLIDRFLIDVTSNEALFPVDLEVMSFLKSYNSKISLFFDDNLLNTVCNDFRKEIYFYMKNIKSTSCFYHTFYGMMLDSLNFIKKRQDTFSISGALFYFRETPQPQENYVLNSRAISFELSSSIICYYNPYKFKNSAKKIFSMQSISLFGYEMFNNKYKRIFFSNSEYYIKILSLKNYPELTYKEAERLWIFLGCTENQWNAIDKNEQNLVVPYDEWEFPLFFSFSLFAISFWHNFSLYEIKSMRWNSLQAPVDLLLKYRDKRILRNRLFPDHANIFVIDFIFKILRFFFYISTDFFSKNFVIGKFLLNKTTLYSFMLFIFEYKILISIYITLLNLILISNLNFFLSVFNEFKLDNYIYTNICPVIFYPFFNSNFFFFLI